MKWEKDDFFYIIFKAVRRVVFGNKQKSNYFVATMDVGDATSTTSMDVVKVGLEKQVGLELEGIQG